MRTSDSGSAAYDFHGVADEAIRSVVHPEGDIDIGQIGHVILGKLFLNGAKESPICCPVLFDVPPKGSHTKSRTKTAPQLLILAEHFQTPWQSCDDDRQLGFLDLFLKPIRNIVRNIRLPHVNEVLELIQRQQPHTAALEQLSEANALFHRVAARP